MSYAALPEDLCLHICDNPQKLVQEPGAQNWHFKNLLATVCTRPGGGEAGAGDNDNRDIYVPLYPGAKQTRAQHILTAAAAAPTLASV